jgi:crotonobetainyl-CoA:carnitine CoA-transferase CaiB-like acyl-CoA transferase
LARLRVAELGSGFGATYAAKLVGDLGAEVLKIEGPEGDPLRARGPRLEGSSSSALFEHLNTSKRSVTIDLGTEAGLAMLDRLCGECDAVIVDADTFVGIDRLAEVVRTSERARALVTVRSLPTAFSTPGGSDLHAQALTGVCSQMGEPGRAPLFWPYGQGGYLAGIVACIALLGVLLPREPVDDATEIDVSGFAALSTLIQGHGAYLNRMLGEIPRRTGARATLRPYPTGLFPCRDGVVAIHSSDDVMWRRLGEMMGEPEWISDPAFDDRWQVARDCPEIGDVHLLPWLATRDRDDLFHEALRRRLSLAPVVTNADVLASEQLEARGYWRTVADGNGDAVRFPGPPFQLSVTPSMPGRAQELGESTEDVLARVGGCDESEIDQLREQHVV